MLKLILSSKQNYYIVEPVYIYLNNLIHQCNSTKQTDNEGG